MKILRFIPILLIFFVAGFTTNALSQENKPTNFPRSNELPTLLNNESYVKKDISITAPDDTKTYKSLKDLEEELQLAAQYYKEEKYPEAYPILAELSQWGIKSAQSLLGAMYIKGQHVDQSFERGLAWLGVAKESRNDKSTKSMFKHVYKQLDKTQKAYIDNKVDDYIAKYGTETQTVICKKKRAVGSHIPVKKCSKIPGSDSPLFAIE